MIEGSGSGSRSGLMDPDPDPEHWIYHDLLSGWIWAEDVPRGGELLRVRGSLPELRGRPHRAGQGQARAARRESRHQCKSRFFISLSQQMIPYRQQGNAFFSVADPGSLSRIRLFSIPGSEFFPSRIRIKEFKYCNPKKLFLSSKKCVPGCSSPDLARLAARQELASVKTLLFFTWVNDPVTFYSCSNLGLALDPGRFRLHVTSTTIIKKGCLHNNGRGLKKLGQATS